MSAAALVAEILEKSGLTQAELARRAGLQRSVLNAYLRGHREPGADALLRIAGAAGVKLELEERKPPVDPQRASYILNQVLGLAEALPFRPGAEMAYPPLKDRLAKPSAA
jgi:transcriptional regulator with XRE-family HTH domain